MPIKSYRLLYKIETITRSMDDDPIGIDPTVPVGGVAVTTEPLYVLMKKSIGDFLGIVPLEWDAPEMTGTFGGNGTNKLTPFRRRIGGFRVASYTLVSTGKFLINEYLVQPNGSIVTTPKAFKSISIGLPTGHSVTEFIAFLKTTGIIDQVAALRTPAGRNIPISVGTVGPAP